LVLAECSKSDLRGVLDGIPSMAGCVAVAVLVARDEGVVLPETRVRSARLPTSVGATEVVPPAVEIVEARVHKPSLSHLPQWSEPVSRGQC